MRQIEIHNRLYYSSVPHRYRASDTHRYGILRQARADTRRCRARGIGRCRAVEVLTSGVKFGTFENYPYVCITIPKRAGAFAPTLESQREISHLILTFQILNEIASLIRTVWNCCAYTSGFRLYLCNPFDYKTKTSLFIL